MICSRSNPSWKRNAVYAIALMLALAQLVRCLPCACHRLVHATRIGNTSFQLHENSSGHSPNLVHNKPWNQYNVRRWQIDLGPQPNTGKKNTKTTFSRDCPGISWGFYLCVYCPPQGITPENTETNFCHPPGPGTTHEMCLCLCVCLSLIDLRHKSSK